MTDNKIEYNLLEGTPTGTYSVRNGFASVADAKQYAESCTGRSEREFKIQQVVTTRSTIEIFTVRARPRPSLYYIAVRLYVVYAESIDWKDEDYLALNESDKLLVQDMVHENSDDCSNCGWTFENHYLSDGDDGLICDTCERELEELKRENDDE
jgi:hypothetical protein